MVAKNAEHPAACDLTVADVFFALSDPMRLSIVKTLAESGRELPWGSFDLPIARSTLSHHLKVLRGAGLIANRQEGTRCFVSLRIDDLRHRFPGLLEIAMSAPPPASRS